MGKGASKHRGADYYTTQAQPYYQSMRQNVPVSTFAQQQPLGMAPTSYATTSPGFTSGSYGGGGGGFGQTSGYGQRQYSTTYYPSSRYMTERGTGGYGGGQYQSTSLQGAQYEQQESGWEQQEEYTPGMYSQPTSGYQEYTTGYPSYQTTGYQPSYQTTGYQPTYQTVSKKPSAMKGRASSMYGGMESGLGRVLRNEGMMERGMARKQAGQSQVYASKVAKGKELPATYQTTSSVPLGQTSERAVQESGYEEYHRPAETVAQQQKTSSGWEKQPTRQDTGGWNEPVVAESSQRAGGWQQETGGEQEQQLGAQVSEFIVHGVAVEPTY